ncbi:MAG: SDR family NAD(P)-dependent oxidoreductase [Myxococcota bacterium]
MGSSGRLENKVAIVTGAARGTGAEIARHFVREGAKVWIADLLDDLAGKLAAELGESARAIHLDVTDEAEWARVVEEVTGRDGRIDVLVNNAAILKLASLVETTGADFERLIRVNQIGPFLGIRAVLEPMKEVGGGSIVNIASVDGFSAKNGVIAYASTKWALRGITKVAAIELGRYGVRVNAVCPEAGGPEMVRPFLPEGVEPEVAMQFQWPILHSNRDRTIEDRLHDIAYLVTYLASDESQTCTGGDFVIDGGHSAGRLLKAGPRS